MLPTLRCATLCTLLAIFNSSAIGALPVRSPAMMLQDSTLAVQAKVLRIYERKDTSVPGQVITYAVAELEVVSVQKGVGVQTGDKVLVRYWWRKWLPGSAPVPGSDGNTTLPTEGETLQVYVGGTQYKGFQVLLPGGFVK